MSQVRANSSPDLIFPSATKNQPFDDVALQGVAANVKLLLKLIQDHKIACDQEKTDHRRMLRVATMMTILDNVRERIQKCQSFGNKRGEAELRRCNTDLRRSPVPRDDKRDDEKEGLRRDLSASLAGLQMMCSSLGKEKQIMSAELSKKVHELSEMEEIINNLKEQNETLRQKVQECFSEHMEKKTGSKGEPPAVALVLQERNKALSEQLLRSLDGYRSMKRKLKVAQEENVMMHDTIDEMGAKVVRSLERVRSLKEGMSSSSVDVQEEIAVLERVFEGFKMVVEKHDKKLGECSGHHISALSKPSILA
ncbi:hypothetical protein ACS0TY_018039 [Phlomoides rotata]